MTVIPLEDIIIRGDSVFVFLFILHGHYHLSIFDSACIGLIDPDLEKEVDLASLRVEPLKPIIHQQFWRSFVTLRASFPIGLATDSSQISITNQITRQYFSRLLLRIHIFQAHCWLRIIYLFWCGSFLCSPCFCQNSFSSDCCHLLMLQCCFFDVYPEKIN